MKHEPAPAGRAPRSKFRGDAGMIALFIAVAVLYFAREILIPFAFALTLTFLLTPAVALLQKLRAGRAASVLTAVLVSIAAVGAIGWIIANQLVDVANQLPLYRENIQSKIQTFHIPVTGQLGHAAESVREVVRELTGPATPSAASLPQRQSRKLPIAPPPPASPVPVQVVETPASGWAELRDWGTPFLSPLGRAGMVVIFTVFMLLKREDLRNRLLSLAGLGQLNRMTQALDDASNRVSRYLLMQFLVNAGFGALFGVGLYWIGVPNPLLWGVLAGLLRIVPYVGPWLPRLRPWHSHWRSSTDGKDRCWCLVWYYSSN